MAGDREHRRDPSVAQEVDDRRIAYQSVVDREEHDRVRRSIWRTLAIHALVGVARNRESNRRSLPGRGLRRGATGTIFTFMGEYSAGTLDRVFSAVSDPTRRAILARLAESDARVTDVASAFPISLNSTSKHIRVLEGAGLVRRRVRGREHILTLDAGPLAEAAGWVEHYRRFWSDQLASLDAFVTGRARAERSW